MRCSEASRISIRSGSCAALHLADSFSQQVVRQFWRTVFRDNNQGTHGALIVLVGRNPLSSRRGSSAVGRVPTACQIWPCAGNSPCPSCCARPGCETGDRRAGRADGYPLFRRADGHSGPLAHFPHGEGGLVDPNFGHDGSSSFLLVLILVSGWRFSLRAPVQASAQQPDALAPVKNAAILSPNRRQSNASAAPSQSH